jgi:hypothetical protein
MITHALVHVREHSPSTEAWNSSRDVTTTRFYLHTATSVWQLASKHKCTNCICRRIQQLLRITSRNQICLPLVTATGFRESMSLFPQ